MDTTKLCEDSQTSLSKYKWHHYDLVLGRKGEVPFISKVLSFPFCQVCRKYIFNFFFLAIYSVFRPQLFWQTSTVQQINLYLRFKKILFREAINKKTDFLWNHFIKWWSPPSPFYEVPIYFSFDHFLSEKREMISKVVWRVLMVVLRVFEGCWWVF